METLERFVREENIGFPLIADTQKDIRKKYGRGRITYLIDKQGVIRFIQKGVPENAVFLDQLKLIQ